MLAHATHLLPQLVLVASAMTWAVIVTPTLVRSAGGDGRLITVVSLYVIGAGQALLVLADPNFEHSFSQTAPIAQGSGLHDQLSRLLYVSVFFLIALAIVGSFSRGRSGDFRWWVGGLLAYTLYDAISGPLHGDFNLRPLVLPGLIFLITRSRDGFFLREVTPHLRYILRFITIGSLIMLFIDRQHATLALNDRFLFGYEQLAGLTQHPNALGPLAATAIAVELIDRTRPSILGLAGAMGACLLAQSRAGWLCGLVVIAFFMLTKTRLGSALLAGGVVLAYAGRLVAGNLTPIGALGLGHLDNLHGRASIWATALEIFRRNPVLGGGPRALSDQAEIGRLPAAGAQAHNQVLQTLSSDGLVGGSLLVALFIGLTGRAMTHLRSGQFLPLAVWTLFLADSMFETTMRPWFLPIVLVTLITASPQPAQSGGGPEETENVVTRNGREPRLLVSVRGGDGTSDVRDVRRRSAACPL